MPTYKIVRFYQDPQRESVVKRTGLTLEEAQAHCTDPETSSRTATSLRSKEHTRKYGAWFDGYTEEK